MATAVLVDGGFFLKRYRALVGNGQNRSPAEVSKFLFEMALKHLTNKKGENRDLYRIFFYDCPPSKKKHHHPITKRAVDFAKSEEAVFRLALHAELRQLRKMALRLGHVQEGKGWIIRPDKTHMLLSGRIEISELQPGDINYDFRQKGVDMKIGLDIASLAYKKLVDQIILIAGDSDFVPAAKLARREGIDFILDPMWNHIHPSLFEHIDGLRSVCPRPTASSTQ